MILLNMVYELFNTSIYFYILSGNYKITTALNDTIYSSGDYSSRALTLGESPRRGEREFDLAEWEDLEGVRIIWMSVCASCVYSVCMRRCVCVCVVVCM